MKVYTVLTEYVGYDARPTKYLGVYDSLEKVIDELGMEEDYMKSMWGGMKGYIEWLNENHITKTPTGSCYRMYGRNMEIGEGLVVYETEVIDLIRKHKLI